MKSTTKISINASKQYLSEAISNLPTNCLFDKGKVGCGGTTIALKDKNSYVIAVPFRTLIANKVAQYNGLVFGVDGYTSKKQLMDYLDSVEIPKIMVTFDSVKKLSKWIDTSKYMLLVDEFHLLFTQYSFRRDAAQCVLNNYQSYKNYCFMTATVLEEEFILDELKEIPIVIADWELVREVNVVSVKCNNSVSATVSQLIKEFLDGTKQGNAYFFVNSVEFIKEMVQECGLTDDNTRAIWSINNKTETGLLRGNTIDTPKKINLLTSTVFEGSDIYDEDGYIFIVSDSRKSHTMIDISTSFQQIAGRIRNTKHWENIYHLYTSTRYDVDVTYEEKKESTLKAIDEAVNIVAQYNKLSDSAKEGIKIVSNEMYIDKIGSDFIFDSNLVKIDLYNFKVTKCLYRLRVNIKDEYIKNGFTVSEYVHDALEITRMDRVDDLNFKETVEEVEKEANELPLFNFNNRPVYEAACIKYSFLNDAINKLGFEGIRDCGYVITNIKAKLITKSDSGLENKVFKMLKNKLTLSVGDFIASSKIKEVLKDIYNGLGIKKTAKGTDINNYFEVKASTKSINKKTVTGFVIVSNKIIF